MVAGVSIVRSRMVAEVSVVRSRMVAGVGVVRSRMVAGVSVMRSRMVAGVSVVCSRFHTRGILVRSRSKALYFLSKWASFSANWLSHTAGVGRWNPTLCAGAAPALSPRQLFRIHSGDCTVVRGKLGHGVSLDKAQHESR